MLSIIVPVYNAEEYVEKCIESILSQAYKDIQLILVDDGSTDSSGEICDRIALNDNRVRVFHTPNQGAICSRLFGIEHAEGEYISFADADDWIDENMYSDLMHKLGDTGADFITSGMIFESRTQDVVVDGLAEGMYFQSKDRKYVKEALWDFNSVKCGITPPLWNKVFRKEYILEAFLSVDKRISLGDDRAIIYTALLSAKSFIVTHSAYYHYRIHDDSLCHDVSKAGFEQIELMWKYMRDFYISHGVYDSVRDSFERNLKELLEVAEKNAFGLTDVNYVFPFGEIPQGSRLVIYGLGVVGRSFCRYLFLTKYAKIVAIADKSLAGSEFNGVPVIDICEILSNEFDYILIANLRENIASEIRNDLIGLGIKDDVIKWGKPLIV